MFLNKQLHFLFVYTPIHVLFVEIGLQNIVSGSLISLELGRKVCQVIFACFKTNWFKQGCLSRNRRGRFRGTGLPGGMKERLPESLSKRREPFLEKTLIYARYFLDQRCVVRGLRKWGRQVLLVRRLFTEQDFEHSLEIRALLNWKESGSEISNSVLKFLNNFIWGISMPNESVDLNY